MALEFKGNDKFKESEDKERGTIVSDFFLSEQSSQIG